MNIVPGDLLEKVYCSSTANATNYPIGSRVEILEVLTDGFSVLDEEGDKMFLPFEHLSNWKKLCMHTYRKYVGFSDVYYYCIGCDKKQTVNLMEGL